eukprot:comp14706_c0_seq1/m.11088 comp14706_c0_seq1/g.11088  ORF comp14706_c0_seq1/g.11088 comp14706_c0_seq1/m.11088 type:complete len:192 (-) comp14706_c0_seq1:180-755(-)
MSNQPSSSSTSEDSEADVSLLVTENTKLKKENLLLKRRVQILEQILSSIPSIPYTTRQQLQQLESMQLDEKGESGSTDDSNGSGGAEGVDIVYESSDTADGDQNGNGGNGACKGNYAPSEASQSTEISKNYAKIFRGPVEDGEMAGEIGMDVDRRSSGDEAETLTPMGSLSETTATFSPDGASSEFPHRKD